MSEEAKGAKFKGIEDSIVRWMVGGYRKRAERTQDPYVLVRVAMLLIQNLKCLPFQQMELELNRLESDAHLVAWPIEFPGKLPPDEFVSKIPVLDGETEYSYFLNVTFGEPMFNKAMTILGTTPEENIANLNQTGILYPKPGSRTSRILHARLN